MTEKARGLWEAFLEADERYKETQAAFLAVLLNGGGEDTTDLRRVGQARQLAVQGAYLAFRGWVEEHPEALTAAEAAPMRAEAERRGEEAQANSMRIYLALPTCPLHGGPAARPARRVN